MRESRTYGSVRGVLSNGHPYRDSLAALTAQAGKHLSGRQATPAFSRRAARDGRPKVEIRRITAEA